MCQVVVNYASSAGAAEDVASQIKASGGDAIVVGADLGKAEDIDTHLARGSMRPATLPLMRASTVPDRMRSLTSAQPRALVPISSQRALHTSPAFHSTQLCTCGIHIQDTY